MDVSEYNFPISEVVPKYEHDGALKDGDQYKCVIRTDTGDLLSIMSYKYKPVLYKVVIDAFESALGEHTFERHGWTERNGARLFATYEIEDEIISIGGQDVKPHLILINSYDGSYAETIRIMGMHPEFSWFPITTKSKSTIKRKHVGNAEQDFLLMLNSAMEVFDDSIIELKSWDTVGVSVKQAEDIIAGFTSPKKANEEALTNFKAVSDKNLFKLFEVFEASLMGHTRVAAESAKLDVAQWGFDLVRKNAGKVLGI